MDSSKPHPDPQDYHEGKEAAERFLQGVKNVLFTSPEELKKRREAREKARKAEQKKTKK